MLVDRVSFEAGGGMTRGGSEVQVQLLLEGMCRQESISYQQMVSMLLYLVRGLPPGDRLTCWRKNLSLLTDWLQKEWVVDSVEFPEVEETCEYGVEQALEEELTFWEYLAAQGRLANVGVEFLLTRAQCLLVADEIILESELLMRLGVVLSKLVDVDEMPESTRCLLCFVLCILFFKASEVDAVGLSMAGEQCAEAVASLLPLDATWEVLVVQGLRLAFCEVDAIEDDEGGGVAAIIHAFAIVISGNEQARLHRAEGRLALLVAPSSPWSDALPGLFARVFNKPPPKEEREVLTQDLAMSLRTVLQRPSTSLNVLVQCFQRLNQEYKLGSGLSKEVMKALLSKGGGGVYWLGEYCECLELLGVLDLDAGHLSDLERMDLELFMGASFNLESYVERFGEAEQGGGCVQKYTGRLERCVRALVLKYGLCERVVAVQIYTAWEVTLCSALNSLRGLLLSNQAKQGDGYYVYREGRKVVRQYSLYHVHMHNIERLPCAELVKELDAVKVYCRIQYRNAKLPDQGLE